MGGARRYVVEAIELAPVSRAPIAWTAVGASYEDFSEAHAAYVRATGPKRLVAVLAEDLGA